MARFHVKILIAVLFFILLLAACEQAAQEDKTSEPKQDKKTTPKKQAENGKKKGLPTLADIEGYEDWLKFNSEPIQGRTHGETNIYINKERDEIAPDGELKFPFPDGTIIVKDTISNDLIAIMRKEKGADAAHNDWQWIEFGSNESVIGKDEACWSCHSQAEAQDYVFTDLDNP